MSQFLQCDRCETTAPIGDEKISMEWAALTDANNNWPCENGNTHLCGPCLKAFADFMNPPKAKSPQPGAAA